MHKRHSSAFTIVELLIAIVVIAILAAVVIVAYNGVRDRSIRSSVQSTVQQAQKKILTFAVDHNESYPDQLSDVGITNTSTTTYDYVVDNSASPKRYCIQATISQISYVVGYIEDENAWVNTPSVGVCREGWLANAKVKAVSAGYRFMCVINDTDDAYCRGDNTLGQLGDGTTTTTSSFVAVDTTGALSGKKLKSIGVGGDQGTSSDHACAITLDGQVYCWGANGNGQLGNGNTTQSSFPVSIDMTGVLAGKTIKSLSVGVTHNCVIASDNNAYCWGANGSGQLGNGNTNQSNVPVAVSTTGALLGETIKQISVGPSSTCVIASDDLAYCWGSNSFGTLGTGSSSNSSVPSAVDTTTVLAGLTVKSLLRNNNRTCAIASDNQLYCWGYEIGDGSSVTIRSPVQIAIPGGETARSLYGSTPNNYQSSICFTTSQRDLYCWGRMTHTTTALTPTAVASPSGLHIERMSNSVESVVSRRAYGIGSDGQFYGWSDLTSTPVLISVPW